MQSRFVSNSSMNNDVNNTSRAATRADSSRMKAKDSDAYLLSLEQPIGMGMWKSMSMGMISPEDSPRNSFFKEIKESLSRSSFASLVGLDRLVADDHSWKSLGNENDDDFHEAQHNSPWEHSDYDCIVDIEKDLTSRGGGVGGDGGGLSILRAVRDVGDIEDHKVDEDFKFLETSHFVTIADNIRKRINCTEVAILAANDLSHSLECIAPVSDPVVKISQNVAIAGSCFQFGIAMNVPWTHMYSRNYFEGGAAGANEAMKMSVLCVPIFDGSGKYDRLVIYMTTFKFSLVLCTCVCV